MTSFLSLISYKYICITSSFYASLCVYKAKIIPQKQFPKKWLYQSPTRIDLSAGMEVIADLRLGNKVCLTFFHKLAAKLKTNSKCREEME